MLRLYRVTFRNRIVYRCFYKSCDIYLCPDFYKFSTYFAILFALLRYIVKLHLVVHAAVWRVISQHVKRALAGMEAFMT